MSEETETPKVIPLFEIVRQQWSFSPQGSTSEIEDLSSQFR
jgi:hypothetical protein